MKKFLVIILTVIACIISAVSTSYFLRGKTIFIVNGAVVTIIFLISRKKWRKIEEEKSKKMLEELSEKIRATNAEIRDGLIKKETFSWGDMVEIAERIERSTLSKDDLPEMLGAKSLPKPLRLVEVSDIK